jgi:hypothetical protein
MLLFEVLEGTQGTIDWRLKSRLDGGSHGRECSRSLFVCIRRFGFRFHPPLKFCCHIPQPIPPVPMSFIPSAFRSIGWPHALAAASIIGALKYVQAHHDNAQKAAAEEYYRRRQSAREAEEETARWEAEQEEARRKRAERRRQKQAEQQQKS